MTDLTVTFSEPKTKAEYERAVRRMLEDMARMNAAMDQDRREIDRLREETRAALAGLGAAI